MIKYPDKIVFLKYRHFCKATRQKIIPRIINSMEKGMLFSVIKKLTKYKKLMRKV